MVVLAAQAADDFVAEYLAGLKSQQLQAIVLPLDTGTLDRSELAEQLHKILDAEPAPAGVLSLLAYDKAPYAERPEISGGLAASLVLMQALADTGRPVPTWWLTSGAVSTAADDTLCSPVQAQIWGMARVAALEYPQLWGGLIDLPAEPDERGWYQLAAILTEQGEEDQLAIRPAGVLVRRLVRAPLPARQTGADWRPSGTVLVTGGTGALGPYIARWLATTGAEELVLISRRGPEAAGMTELQRELADRGVRVSVVACDVGDRAALARLLDELAADGRPVRTVVHAAALMQLNSVTGTGVDELADVVAAKVSGAINLDELLGDSLDDFVLFSSIAGVWGSADHVAYAAANSFLDAFAELRRSRGRPALSVAWGVWGSASLPAGVDPAHLRQQGLPLIDPELAFAGLRQSLAADETFVALAEVDWQRFLPVFSSARRRPLLDGVPEVAAQLAAATSEQPSQDSALADTLAGRPEAEQREIVLRLVVETAASTLGHQSPQAIAGGRAFSALGFDSLSAIELRNRLTAATGLRLPTTLIFDHPSPAAVAEFLRHQLVPDVQSEQIHAELDRLEAALGNLPALADGQHEYADRLRSLLDRLAPADRSTGRAGRPAPPGGDDDLEFATDEDIFDALDQELD